MEQRTKPYLLTGGLVALLENRHGFQLRQETQRRLRELEVVYANELAKLLDGRKDKDDKGDFVWQVKFISDNEIEDSLAGILIGSKQGLARRPLVSFDDVYGQKFPDTHYDITRMQDPNKISESPVLSPRFNAPSLDLQAEGIAACYGSEVDIMDIGAFGGDTLCDEILGRFKNAGLKVRNVNLVFAGQEAIQKLTNLGVKVNYAHTFDWVDWLELRDCIGFDGRKVKMPSVEERPDNLFVRYTERASSWASIPEEFVQDYKRMYDFYFNSIGDVLAGEGLSASLTKSKENELVYELRLKRL